MLKLTNLEALFLIVQILVKFMPEESQHQNCFQFLKIIYIYAAISNATLNQKIGTGLKVFDEM